MKCNKFKELPKNIEKFINKYGLYILMGLFVLGPIIINWMFRKNSEILGFTKPDMLDYYGVIVSGVITFLVLRITVNNNNETTREQFNFQIRQRQIETFENEFKKNIVYIINIQTQIYDIIDYRMYRELRNKKNYCNNDEFFMLYNQIICNAGREIFNINNKLSDIILLIELSEPTLKKDGLITDYLFIFREIIKKIIDILMNISNELEKIKNGGIVYSEDNFNKIIFFSELYVFSNQFLQKCVDQFNNDNKDSLDFIKDNFYNFIIAINENN